MSFLVAPYEADAQLAFLCASGIADGVITEDSDTLPYRCSTVLFKMERDGSATAIERTPSAAFFRRHKCESGGKVDTISLAGFKDASVRDGSEAHWPRRHAWCGLLPQALARRAPLAGPAS